jgi:hypothetical protein
MKLCINNCGKLVDDLRVYTVDNVVVSKRQFDAFKKNISNLSNIQQTRLYKTD